jgi:hypothetical protein
LQTGSLAFWMASPSMTFAALVPASSRIKNSVMFDAVMSVY